MILLLKCCVKDKQRDEMLTEDYLVLSFFAECSLLIILSLYARIFIVTF